MPTPDATEPDRRLKVVDAIASLPEEAFGHVVLRLRAVCRELVGNGGFRATSREGFKRLGMAADAYFSKG